MYQAVKNYSHIKNTAIIHYIQYTAVSELSEHLNLTVVQ